VSVVIVVCPCPSRQKAAYRSRRLAPRDPNHPPEVSNTFTVADVN
jgi:hypothetical protein